MKYPVMQHKKEEKKILVVDDDKDLCDLISDIISEEGYSVQKAYDANTAISKIIKEKIDVLIIDNKLAGASGINVIEQSKFLNPGLKTIMISAFGNTNTKLRARDLGVYDFLDKPFDIKHLTNRVSELIFDVKQINYSIIF
jgi:DNA-binding response OmpR family regulator